MCEGEASFIYVNNKVYFSKYTDSHHVIEREIIAKGEKLQNPIHVGFFPFYKYDYSYDFNSWECEIHADREVSDGDKRKIEKLCRTYLPLWASYRDLETLNWLHKRNTAKEDEPNFSFSRLVKVVKDPQRSGYIGGQTEEQWNAYQKNRSRDVVNVTPEPKENACLSVDYESDRQPYNLQDYAKKPTVGFTIFNYN